MLTIKMAWKNMWRNRNRTGISMMAIFFAVMLSVLTSSLQDGVFDNLVKNMVSFYSGYLQIHQKGYWNEQVLDNSFKSSAAMEAGIIADKRIDAISARLESFALVSAGELTKGCMVVGIDPRKEDQITSIRSKLTAGKFINADDNAVLLAEGLLKRLKLQLNDTVVLIGQGYHGSTAAGKYSIRGILKFGSPDLNDKTLFMPLLLAQDLYGAQGMITTYVISINIPADLDAVSQSIKNISGSNYEVMTWEEMMPDIKQHIRSDTVSMQIIEGILYLLICFGIFGTLLMMMAERKYELGMLVAIGMKKRKLTMMLVTESVITVLSGCLLGILAAIPLVIYLNRHPIRITGETAAAYQRFGFEPIFPTSVAPENFIWQGLIVFSIGIILSMYPVYKIIRLDPVTAMRK